MSYKNAPNGFSVVEETEEYVKLNFQVGAHFGGEAEIRVPSALWDKFCNDVSWRRRVLSKYSKIKFLGAFPGQIEIPELEKNKTGTIPVGEI